MGFCMSPENEDIGFHNIKTSEKKQRKISFARDLCFVLDVILELLSIAKHWDIVEAPLYYIEVSCFVKQVKVLFSSMTM